MVILIPSSYIGVPISTKQLHSYYFVPGHYKQRCYVYQFQVSLNQCISTVGRIVLVKSGLLSFPNYLVSFYPILNDILDNITKLCYLGTFSMVGVIMSVAFTPLEEAILHLINLRRVFASEIYII